MKLFCNTLILYNYARFVNTTKVYNAVMKFFVLNGHKYYPFAKGLLNATLFNKIAEILSPHGEVMTTIIENGYDADEEIEKFKQTDFIIFQTPMNWFSVPWIFKKYIDEIYRYGEFYSGSEQYGRGGLLKGKKYMFSITCNAVEQAFDDPQQFFEGRSPEDLIIALHKTQQFCAMEPVRSYFCFDVVHNPDIQRYLKGLENHIHTYVLNDRLA